MKRWGEKKGEKISFCRQVGRLGMLGDGEIRKRKGGKGEDIVRYGSGEINNGWGDGEIIKCKEEKGEKRYIRVGKRVWGDLGR